jgi:ectoine hydroxylase-related dioxygenase (phytanoyl-CoA dioxygenase family)
VLTEAQREQWERDGYVPLGQVASDAEIEALRARMDAIMLGRAPRDGIWFQLDTETGDYGDLRFGDGSFQGPTLNYRKIEQLHRDPLFLAYLRHPVFRSITHALVGEDVSIYRAMFMNKPAGRGTHLPYHQDGGTQWGLDRDPIVTIWTALDDATVDHGCVQVIPGSHRLGLLSDRGHTITPEQEAQYARSERSRYLEVKAGEILLLHNFLLHRSGVNRTGQPRRAFSVCFMDAATRYTGPGAPRTFPTAFGSE